MKKIRKSRPQRLIALCLLLLFPTLLAAESVKSLNDKAMAKGLFYGAAVDDELFNDKKFQEIFNKEVGILTPSNACNFENIQTKKGVFSFEKCDNLVNYADTHDMLVHGHSLIYHLTEPKWLKSEITSDNAEAVLKNHITTVVKRYKGKVHSWTVVNEAIQVVDGNTGGYRSNIWFQTLGSSYIEKAFRAARKADPNAILVYNDYWLEVDGPLFEEKRETVLSMLKELKNRGVPVDALGIQAHLWPDASHSTLAKFLQKVANLNIKIIVTELDVTEDSLPANITKRDQEVAKVYKEFLSIVMKEPALLGVITWGLSDKYTWLETAPFSQRKDGLPVRPLPYDAAMNKKPAWYAIAEAFDKRVSSEQ